jgi:hypothetical protein
MVHSVAYKAGSILPNGMMSKNQPNVYKNVNKIGYLPINYEIKGKKQGQTGKTGIMRQSHFSAM